MILYGHFVEDAQKEALEAGIKGRWVSVDLIGRPDYAAEVIHWCANPGTKFSLFIFLTEDRLFNKDGAWDNMRIAIQWLKEVKIHEQCELIQFDDEFWSRLPGLGHAGSPHSPFWPMFKNKTVHECWNSRFQLATEMAKRANELRKMWTEVIGGECPRIGVAESGGVAPPQFDGQEWWGLNIYHHPLYVSRSVVQDVYRQAWAFTSLPIMPVLPVFREKGAGPHSVWELAQTYAAPFNINRVWYPAILDHPQTFAIGVFQVNHAGDGLTNLDASYKNALRFISEIKA
jgi:hypothetical protein